MVGVNREKLKFDHRQTETQVHLLSCVFLQRFRDVLKIEVSKTVFFLISSTLLEIPCVSVTMPESPEKGCASKNIFASKRLSLNPSRKEVGCEVRCPCL